MSGVLPVTLCELYPGETYRILVEGAGLEKRRGKFHISQSGGASIQGIRIGTAWRNAAIPGWGSISAGRAAAGLTDGMSLAASLYVLWVEEMEYRHLRNRLEILEDMRLRAGTFEERFRIQDAAHVTSLDVNAQNSHRKRLVILTTALYGHQVLDSWLSGYPPRMVSEAGGSVAKIDAAPSTRIKAFVHSLIRPGRGQFYQGKITRGMLFSTMSTIAGLVALDYHNRYDEDVNRYNVAVERFEAAATYDEKIRLRDEASKLWNDVEEEKRRRNVSYIALAGLWCLNLVDTLFPAESKDSLSRYSMELGPGGCALVMKF